ncbi:MAG: DUF6428 family protein [Pseudomonadota bacterium]
MTLAEFQRRVQALPEGPVALVFDSRPAREGFHVTELRRQDVRAVDCAAQTEAWTETLLQVLDGGGGRPMTTATLRGLLSKAVPAAGADPDAPVRVEYGGVEEPLRVFSPEDGPGDVLRFASTRAVCRPMQRGCCG